MGLAAAPLTDVEGLRAVYRAWCTHIPFDSVRKMIALRTNPAAPLPGGHVEDFFQAWLADGTGATCWPSSNALFELLHSLGFQARRVTGSMGDTGVANHASVIVTIEGSEWLVDASIFTSEPLPLQQEAFAANDPIFPTRLEFNKGTHILWTHIPGDRDYLPCRIHGESVTHAEYLQRYEASRARSPFNERLYARRNRDAELVLLVGHSRISRTPNGVQSRELTSEQLTEALHNDIGISERAIEQWARSGALAASSQAASRKCDGK
jgi:arylamine N-acetyltransferase